MDDNNKTPDTEHDTPEAPADALSRTPEELEEEHAKEAAEHPSAPSEPPKKLPLIKRLFSRINPYFLGFILLLIIAAAVTVVVYLNSKKQAPTPTIATQTLTENALKQLANSDASIGGSSQTLTIQGNAVINGQTLMRGKLDIAGTLQTSGKITAASLSVAGATTLGATQTKALQVQGNTVIQGDATAQNLAISGTATFNGPVTANQLTVSQLTLSGNAQLTIPNHIRFDGPTPGRSINSSALGSGGSASVSGSDTSGTVNISTGNNPSNGCMVTLTFHTPYSNNPHVIISPVNAGAAQMRYYVTRSTTSFSICSAGSTPAHSTFAYDYFITN